VFDVSKYYPDCCVAQLTPKECREIFADGATELTQEEKATLIQKWGALMEQGGELRVVVDGELQNVSIDYYDEIILSMVNDGENEMHYVVGDFIIKIRIDAFFVADRIYKMIADGRLLLLKPTKKEFCCPYRGATICKA
jgi:hypothetical protein